MEFVSAFVMVLKVGFVWFVWIKLASVIKLIAIQYDKFALKVQADLQYYDSGEKPFMKWMWWLLSRDMDFKWFWEKENKNSVILLHWQFRQSNRLLINDTCPKIIRAEEKLQKVNGEFLCSSTGLKKEGKWDKIKTFKDYLYKVW